MNLHKGDPSSNLPTPQEIMGRMPMPRSTGVSPVNTHGQDAHATGSMRLLGQDGDATVEIRQGAHLPHWTADRGIYAITFRLADALPAAVWKEWKDERKLIEETSRQMNRPLSRAEEDRLRELNSAKIETWLDAGHGECWMNNDAVAEEVASALKHFNGTRYDLIAWCVMPNHVHVVARPYAGHKLSAVLHSWKSFSAKQCNAVLNRDGQFWQTEYYDHLIRDERDLHHAIEYTLDNPSVAGLHDWKWNGMNVPEDLL